MQPVAHQSAAAAQAILSALGIPATAVNVPLLQAWITCEKGADGDAWQWNNPLNTTEPGFGSTQTVNAAGVRVYPSEALGAQATAATLLNGYYPLLVAGLRESNAHMFFSGASEISVWGTDPACVEQVWQGLGAPATLEAVPATSSITVTPTGIVVTPEGAASVTSPPPLGEATLYPYAAASPPTVTPLPEYAPQQAFESQLPFNQRISTPLPTVPYEAIPLYTQVTPAAAPSPPSPLPVLVVVAGLAVAYLAVGRPRGKIPAGG